MTEEQKHQALFFQLIMSFQAAAYQHMGKIKNMLTDKIERDLQQAQLAIDMIEMIKIKTEGHLTEDESKFIEQSLRELRLNYIEELNKDQAKPKEEKSKTKKNNETKNKKTN